jgi:hypothetical protein
MILKKNLAAHLAAIVVCLSFIAGSVKAGAPPIQEPSSVEDIKCDHQKQKLFALFQIGLLVARTHKLAMKSRHGFCACSTDTFLITIRQ